MRRRLAALVLLIVALSAVLPLIPVSAKPEDKITKTNGDREISRWSGKAKLKTTVPEITTKKSESNGVSLHATSKGYDVEIIDKSDGFEYSWILPAKPASNVFTMQIDLTGCTAYYQPPLTAGTYPKGYTVTETTVKDSSGKIVEYRPVNVVGSYAVYSANRDGVYQTGKIAHIYRPLVTDANGNTVWGTMKIEGNTLTVTVDSKWLNKAVYPVKVDPTFGYTSIGGSSYQVGPNTMYGLLATGISAGSLSVNIHMNGTNAVKGLLVLGSTKQIYGSPGSAAVLGAPFAWRTSTFPAPITTSAVPYYICFIINWVGFVHYDAGGTSLYDGSNNYTTPTDPTDEIGGLGWKFSIYVQTAEIPVNGAFTITDMDDTKNCYAQKKDYTLSGSVTDADGYAALTTIDVSFKQGATTRGTIRYNEDTDTFSVTAGTAVELGTGSAAVKAGNTVTLTVKYRVKWGAVSEPDVDIEVTSTDVYGAVDTDTAQTNYVDFITRLVTYNHAANTTTVPINTPISVSGVVRYATTPTGDTASSSYPPDAEFTSVAVIDDQGVTLGTDATIVNGTYVAVGVSASTLRTTAYYAYISMADADYTDGYAPDADITYVSTQATFGFAEFLDRAFAFFGLVGGVTGTVYGMVTSFAAWFTDSALAMVNMATAVVTLILYISGTVISWVTRFSNFFVALINAINNNVWIDFITQFNVAAWIDVVPVLAFIGWYSGLSRRAAHSGRSATMVLISDLQVASWIIGEIWGWTSNVFYFVWNMLNALASRF